MDREPIWSRRIADELWSGVVTPLTFSLLADQMAEHMVRRRLDNAGLSHLAGLPVFRLAHGHVYVNATLVADAMGEVPAVFLSDGLLELLPEELRAGVRAKERWLSSPRTASILLKLTLRERGWMPWSRAAVFRSAASRVAPELERLELAPDAPEDALATTIVDVQAQLATFLETVSWGMIYAYVFFHLTSELLERWAPGHSESIAQLTVGLDGIWTFAIHDQLVRCAAIARRDQGLRRAVEEDPKRVAALALDGGLGSFGATVRELTERHGHRLVGRDLSYPTWRERPAVIVEMVQKLLQADSLESASARRARREELLRRASQRVGNGAGGTLRRFVFERCLDWCQEYYTLRENMRYHADLFLAALRTLALGAGERLASAGGLEDRADVFYLESAELQAALRGRPDAALGREAAARRAAYGQFRDAAVPDTLRGAADEAPAAVDQATTEAPSARELSGLGVSPGRAVGPARVVRSVDDLRSLCAGEVIVAASTDPSWTSLLALGSALVLEMGGLLSHGAIVARELGIPAVVNVAHATRVLATGDWIVVDGRAGTVAFT
ncbi:MAG: PEP-utilizing enzyme [Thermodesulfobacteriota bacterium]